MISQSEFVLQKFVPHLYGELKNISTAKKNRFLVHTVQDIVIIIKRTIEQLLHVF